MTFRPFTSVVIMSALIVLLAACGAQSSSTSAITVTFTPGYTPPTAMTASEPCGVAATVTNDLKNQGVKWTAVCTGASCGDGTFTPTQYSASSVPITYTSPSSASTVTLTATSVTDPTKSISSSAIPIGQTSSGCTAP